MTVGSVVVEYNEFESKSKSESKSSWLIIDLGIVAREPKMPTLRNVITEIYHH